MNKRAHQISQIGGIAMTAALICGAPAADFFHEKEGAHQIAIHHDHPHQDYEVRHIGEANQIVMSAVSSVAMSLALSSVADAGWSVSS
jgi:hypothetical protein